jgi:hypothetical protein
VPLTTPYATPYYACQANPVFAISLFWNPPLLTDGQPPPIPGAPQNAAYTYEQVIFFNLGTHNQGSDLVQIYDDNDYDCGPNNENVVTEATCTFHQLGYAQGAWEIEFNCGLPQPPDSLAPPELTTPCQNGASLQWAGRLYTATSAVLLGTDPTNYPLNEFVYNNGKLYAPRGWQSFRVTATDLVVVSGSKHRAVLGVDVHPQLPWQAGDVIPKGSVSFYSGTTLLGTSTLDKLGLAAFQTVLPVGMDGITAVYNGSSVDAPSTSSVVSVTVK